MKNKYKVMGDYSIIYTHDNKEIIIDTEDLAKIGKHKWCASSRYPQARVGKKIMRLHRFLLSPSADKVVDHINWNSLDNRKSNLRVVDHRTNSRNSKRLRSTKGGFKGVGWHKGSKKWRAYIRANGRFVSLGLYEHKYEALTARLKGEELYFNSQQTCNI